MPDLLAAARAAAGFMPDDEGARPVRRGPRRAVAGPLLEVGSYLGKSTLYLAAAARERGGVVVTVDHHRGSEEHQPGWEYHDPSLVDPVVGRIDTLPGFRRTIAAAGAEDVVVAVVARAETLAALWTRPLAFVFLDGSHTDESARRDYDALGAARRRRRHAGDPRRVPRPGRRRPGAVPHLPAAARLRRFRRAARLRLAAPAAARAG